MTLDRFIEIMWEQAENVGKDACWTWKQSKNSGGYGVVHITLAKNEYKNFQAHRLAYILIYGDPKPGNYVMHLCNNPPCFNPGHLVQGTAKANSQHYQITDAKTREIKTTVLDKEIIRAMQIDRVLGLSPSKICKKYGVSQSSVRKYTKELAPKDEDL